MVQIMKLDDLIVPKGCKVKYTQKMYYSKYIYKMVFEIDRSKLIKSEVQSWRSIRNYHYTNRLALIHDLLKELKKNIKNDDYRIRAENCSISLFTNSLDDINQLITSFSKNAIELYRPLNEQHVEVMDKFRKVVVRQSLFNKDYKFKIYLRFSFELRENRYKDVREFLENLDGEWAVNHILDRFFHTKMGGRHLGYTAAVYLNKVEDLMMFQLKFNNDINKIEEAILLSEL